MEKELDKKLEEILKSLIDLLECETTDRMKKFMNQFEKDKNDDFEITITRTDGKCYSKLVGNAITMILVLMYQVEKLKEHIVNEYSITERELELLLNHYSVTAKEEE